MVNRKPIRTRGKIQFSKYFQKFNEGEKVAVVVEKSIASSFPKRLQGRTGVIEAKRGREYLVRIMDQKKEKRFIINPIHLKKIK